MSFLCDLLFFLTYAAIIGSAGLIVAAVFCGIGHGMLYLLDAWLDLVEAIAGKEV